MTDGGGHRTHLRAPQVYFVRMGRGGGWQIIFSKLGHDIIATAHPPMLFHNAILAFLYEKVGFSSSPFKSRLAL